MRPLVQENKPVGFHRVVWDGTDDGGRKAASGVYFIKFESPRHSEIEKVVLLK